jgi:hypothetical protein
VGYVFALKLNYLYIGKGNLDWLLDDFIDTLQEEFSSTVHAVLKASEKV